MLDKISQLKKQPYKSVVIVGTHGVIKFELRLLTQETENNLKIIRLLAAWRKKHEHWFASQFPVIRKKTRVWLQQKVLATPDRLLFILSVNNCYLGHLGLFRFDWKNKSCDLDNIIRGEVGYPGLMSTALQALMAWGRAELGINHYTLQTISDNSRAVAFYVRLGFTETGRQPVIYQKISSGGEWVAAPVNFSGEIKRYLIYMRRSCVSTQDDKGDYETK